MDFWLPPKPAIIQQAPKGLLEQAKDLLKHAMLPGIILPHGGSAPPPPSLEFRASSVDTSNLTTYTFNTQDFGAADATRRIIVGVMCQAAAGRSISSATIGGVSATLHSNSTGGLYAGLISALVPTGTTGTVAITFNGAVNFCGIGIFRLINESSSSPTDVQRDITSGGTDTATSVTLNVPTSGAIVAYNGSTDSGGARTFTWTNATERFDQVVEGVATHSGASESGQAANGALVVTATTNAATNIVGVLVALTWG